MEKLYAPWRDGYTDEVTHKKKCDLEESCVFCIQFKEDQDDKYFILARFKYSAVLLNKYPYNGGHLLIIPFEHKSQLSEFRHEVRQELMELIAQTSVILKEQLAAQGINVGLNEGKAAGAGIPAHLHVHVLPRWTGDTNFLPTLADTKQISVNLNDFFVRLKPYFQALKNTI